MIILGLDMLGTVVTVSANSKEKMPQKRFYNYKNIMFVML